MPAPYYSSNSMPPANIISENGYNMNRHYNMGVRGGGIGGGGIGGGIGGNYYYMGVGSNPGNHFYRPEEMYDRRPPRIVGSAMDDTHKNPNKVFIGGLSIDTTTHRLRSYMRQFGKIIDVAVLQNKYTGKSRCFGFCSFTDEEAVEKCMQEKHKIDGVPVEVRRALPRSETAQMQYSDEDQNCKIFVGGIPLQATEAQLAEHFEQFGKLKGVMLMYDKLTHKQRGFAFITYENAEDAERAVGEHQFMDSTIETKKAEPRDVAAVSRNRHNMHPVYKPNGYYNRPEMEYSAPYGYGIPYDDRRYGGGSMMYGEMDGQGAINMYENVRGGVGPINGVGGNYDYGYNVGGGGGRGRPYYDDIARFSNFYDSGRRSPGAAGGTYRSRKYNLSAGSRTHPY